MTADNEFNSTTMWYLWVDTNLNPNSSKQILMMFCENRKNWTVTILHILISDVSFIFSLQNGPLPPTATRNFPLMTMSRKARCRLKASPSSSCLLVFPSRLCSEMSCVYRWCIHLKTPCGRRASLSLCTVSKGSNSAFRFASCRRTSHRPALVTQGLGSFLRFYCFSNFVYCNTRHSPDFWSHRFSVTCCKKKSAQPQHVRWTVNSNCWANKIIYHENCVTRTLNIKLTNKCFTFYETGKSFHVFYEALNQSVLLFTCPDQRAREENAAGDDEPAAESPPQHLQHGSGPALPAGALWSQQPDQAESHSQGESVHERRARAAMFLIPSLSTTLQVLSVEKPAPKVIPKPPPQLKDAAQTSEGEQLPKAPPPVAASVPTLQASSGDPAAHSSGFPSHNGLKGPSAASHRGSMLAIDSYPNASTSNMRRFDSHSLLSENSIASSRFDVSEGAPYPEWVCPSLVFSSFGKEQKSG